MTPRDVDELSFRDINAMLVGAMERDRVRQQLALEVALVTAGGFHDPKILSEVQRQLDHGPRVTEKMSLEDYRQWRDEAVSKIAERYVDTSTS